MQTDKEKFKKEFISRLIKFSLKIIDLCDKLPHEKKYYIIIDQLIRSATSVGANIVEAQASSSKRDYTRFFEISLKSANETKYWLLLLRELRRSDPEISILLDETCQIANIIGSSVLTLKGKK